MKVLLRLMPYFQQHAWAFWAGMSGLLVARIFEAMIPLYVKEGIDAIAAGQAEIAARQTTWELAMGALSGPALAIVACVLAQMVVTIISRILIRRIGMNAAFDLRNRVYSHLQLQGPGFFNRYTIGDLMARAINDISLIRQFIAGTTRMTLVLIFTATVGLIFMFSLSVPLTLAVLAPMPVITLVAWRFSKQIYAQSHQVQQGFSELSTFVQENLNGIRTVQAMAQEAREVERFDQVNSRFLEYNMRLFATTSLLGALMPVLAAAGMLVIVGYGTTLVQAGDMSLGTLAAFFSYLALLLWPVREAGSLVSQWQRGASGTARVFEILDCEPEIRDEGSADHPQLTGKVTVRNLCYRYENKDRNALDDLSFTVEPGETIAIIGRVGSGKSTLLRLFVRLLDPTSGQLLLDDHPIRDYPLAYLREQVCLVLQDPFLFADSLGDNIAYDNPERHENEILESADAAALAQTIAEFPTGLGTILGERGVTLSGGQKQRATLARGLIRKTPLLILDDCFSAVDTETEEHILSGLKRLRRDRTTMLVSHRVSTARHADRIIVLDEGRIAEMGSHAELLRSGGFYAELEAAQKRGGQAPETSKVEAS
jgi:ATP-binding cassette subfamily B protein